MKKPKRLRWLLIALTTLNQRTPTQKGHTYRNKIQGQSLVLTTPNEIFKKTTTKYEAIYNNILLCTWFWKILATFFIICFLHGNTKYLSYLVTSIKESRLKAKDCLNLYQAMLHLNGRDTNGTHLSQTLWCAPADLKWLKLGISRWPNREANWRKEK